VKFAAYAHLCRPLFYDFFCVPFVQNFESVPGFIDPISGTALRGTGLTQGSLSNIEGLVKSVIQIFYYDFILYTLAYCLPVYQSSS
jgi:hypothetical protein